MWIYVNADLCSLLAATIKFNLFIGQKIQLILAAIIVIKCITPTLTLRSFFELSQLSVRF